MSNRHHKVDQNQFVTHAELELLAEKLITVRELVDQMSIALTKTIGTQQFNSIRKAQGQPRSRPPYPIHIEVLCDELRNELTTTVRHMCEYRGIEYAGGTSMPALAYWIKDNRVAIAMMPDGPEIFDKLCRRIDSCERVVDWDEPTYVIDHAKVTEANRQVLTASQIHKLAHKLGQQGKGLTKNRVDSLRRNHGLACTVDSDTGVYFYRLGDVLAAHKNAKRYKTRRRSA